MTRRFLLERVMHALVGAVVLRMAGFDAFDGDTATRPPHQRFREIVEAVGVGEGQAVVGTHGSGKATPGEQPGKGVDGIDLPFRRPTADRREKGPTTAACLRPCSAASGRGV